MTPGSAAGRVDVAVVGLGALGSAACWQLARRGVRVVGLERFELGHSRGASHDTSRILRHSYHTAAYVRLTHDAYADWADLERESGRTLVTVVGGLDLFPADPAISAAPYLASLDEVGVPHDVLEAGEVERRWPAFRLPPGTVGLHQERGAVVPAALGTRTMQELARRHGAELRDRTPVLAVEPDGAGVTVRTASGDVRCRAVVVCADAWAAPLVEPLGARLPLEVTLEQVTYFRPPDPDAFAPGRLPLWIWMDDPCFYGFPTYGEPTVKAAQDCGGPLVDPDDRGDATDDEMLGRLAGFMADVLPGSGPPVRSVRCQYTLTPDRDFVISAVPGHPQVVVGLGAAHGFKFAPTFGRLLADLATEGGTATDLGDFRLDRPGLTDPAYAAHWLV